MRLSLADLDGFLRKFESERVPLLATLEVSGCKASVRGSLAKGVDDDDSPLLLIGNCGNEFADCIRFPYRPAEWDAHYADLREVKEDSVDDLTNKIEGIVTIANKRVGAVLGLYELRRD